MNEEMKQWLTANKERYEFYLLHAILHNASLRDSLMATPLLTTDFCRGDYNLIIGAMYHAQKLMTDYGYSVPVPPPPEFLSTYVESAARDFDYEDEVESAMQVIQELQDPDFKDQHYCILPNFLAWFGSVRGKKVARSLNMYNFPDVHVILDEFHNALDAANQIVDIDDSREFDFDKTPAPPQPILTLGEHVICTPGNISNIQGPPKAAKSAVVGAILAATLLRPGHEADTLGFIAANEEGRAVVHADTEQSALDHNSLVRRAYQRAAQTQKAAWLHSFCLTGMEPVLCWEYLLRKIKNASIQHDGIKMVLIDGIADFCSDPNDAKECIELVRKLHKLALDYQCVILTVLHENPGSAAGKTRGHLGSQLDRKAETSLRLMKDEKTGTVTMWAERARHCFVSKNEGLQFHWCNEAKMHVTIREDDEAFIHHKSGKPGKQSKYPGEVTNAFGQDAELSFSQFVDRLVSTAKIAESTAKARLVEYVTANLVDKTPDGKYRKVQPLRAA